MEMGVIQFVQDAVFVIKHQDMAISGALCAPFNRCVRRNRIGARVTLIGIIEGYRDFRLRPIHNHKRNADGPPVPCPRAEIGMYADVGSNRLNIIV